jgi:DNA anti-recombination protein RmuC
MNSEDFREEFREFVVSILRKELSDFREEFRDESMSLIEGITFRVENLEDDLKFQGRRIEELAKSIDEFYIKIDSIKDNLEMKIDESNYRSEELRELIISQISSVKDEFNGYLNSIAEETRSEFERLKDEAKTISTNFKEISKSFEFNVKKMERIEDEFSIIKSRQDIIHDLVRRVKALENRVYR